MNEIKKIVNGLETREENGLTVSILPKGTTIFRGDYNRYYGVQEVDPYGSPLPRKEVYNKDTVLYTTLGERSTGHKYFGFTKNNVEEYGKESQSSLTSVIYTFRLNDDIKLLRIDDENTKMKLISNTDNNEIKKIINTNFGGEKNERLTVSEKDGQLVDFLCDNNYEGYLIGTETKVKGTDNDFHPEIALCSKSFDKLDYTNREIIDIDESEDTKEDTKKTTKNDEDKIGVARNLFGFDGGKKRKTRKMKNKYTLSKKQKGGDLNSELLEASMEGDLEMVKRLLEQGADINQANSAGDTPLYVASEMGHVEVVRILIENGADINQAESNGQTPLMIAVESGHFEVVEALLEYGANLNAKTDEGDTAFDMINERVFPEIATLLKTSQQKSLATKNIKEYKRSIPTLRSLAYRQLDTKTTSEINKNKDVFNIPGKLKLGGKRKTRKMKKSTKKNKKRNKRKTIKKYNKKSKS